MKDIRISMAQMPSVPGDIDGNLERMIHLTETAEGSDIICFPELSLTGYRVPGSELHAVGADDGIIKKISAGAVRCGIAAAFGFAEKGNDGIYISHGLADIDGTVSVHRKTHLGKFEKECFTPGDTFSVISTGKAAIGFQICGESHFPEISTCLTYRGAELMLMPFASPLDAGRRVDTWKKYLPARAYDNGVFAAACNAVKADGTGGGAIVIDPKGNVIAEDRTGGASILTADLKGNMMNRVPVNERKSMREIDFFGSRRPELYHDVTRPPVRRT